MATHLRWYIKKEEKITGPFPGKMISDFLILGRLSLNDEISLNQRIWRTIDNYPELVPEEIVGELTSPEAQEKLRLAQLRVDERSSYDRRTGHQQQPGERRDEKDRRSPEAVTEVRYRVNKNDGIRQIRTDRPYYPYVIGSIIAFFLVMWFVLENAPPPPGAELEVQVKCSGAARPAVDWSHCGLQSSDLSRQNLARANLRNVNLSHSNLMATVLNGADLAFAKLDGIKLDHAQLANANLQRSNLSGSSLQNANLQGANLNGADITGADFTGANLSQAIWVDGQQCAELSVGSCNKP